MKLASDIKTSKEEKSSSSFDLKSLIEKTTSKPSVKKSRTASETSDPDVNTKKRPSRLSENSEAGSSDEAEIEAGVAMLLEMFPTCCKVEAVHCLTIKGGDLESAAQMLLTRMEMGEDIKLSQAQVHNILICGSNQYSISVASRPADQAGDYRRERNQEEDHG